MDHHTRVGSTGRASTLRYRLVPGSTATYDLKLDLKVTLHAGPDTEPALLDAQINAEIDFEVLRLGDGHAVVRSLTRDVGWWVRHGSTLGDDVVDEPLAGLPDAFLLDERGNTVPLADQVGREVAPPDDSNAAPFVLKVLLPLFAEGEVVPGDTWEVLMEHGTRGRHDPGPTRCEYLRVERDDRGHLEPVIAHRYAYEWRDPDSGEQGATSYTATTRVALRDGWPREVEGRIEIEREISETEVVVHATRTH